MHLSAKVKALIPITKAMMTINTCLKLSESCSRPVYLVGDLDADSQNCTDEQALENKLTTELQQHSADLASRRKKAGTLDQGRGPRGV